MTKEVPLSRGLVAIVDDEDYERVMQYKWYAYRSRNTWYATRWVNGGKYVSLHRFILDAPDDMFVDHADMNGLNCTRGNIRLATRGENAHNRGPNKKSSSIYKGVSRSSVYKEVWTAQIKHKGKSYNLGYYDNERDAAIAYNHAAREYHGEFAWFNDIPGWEDITPERRAKIYYNPA